MGYCQNCGEKITSDHAFCPECGQPVKKEQITAAAAPQEEQQQTTYRKPPNKKTKTITLSVIAAAAILGGAYYGIDKTMMVPKAVSEGFIAAVKGNDVAKVKDYVNDGQVELKANDEQTKSFITYLKENPDVMKSITAGLTADSKILDSGISSEGQSSYAKLEQDGKKWGVFDHYTVQVNPVYAKVQSTEDATMVYIDGQKAANVNSNSSKKIGPFLPGTHTIKGEIKNDYGKVENEQQIEGTEGEDVSVDFDWSDHAVYISSDYNDATLFVNGQDTKTAIGDIDYLGPLPMDGSVKIYAEREFDSRKKKTEEISIKKGMDDVALNFDEENTAEASATPKENDTTSESSEINYGVSTNEVSSFIEQYMYATISSINSEDFSIAEPYIDSNGPKYKEQKDYIAYLINKGITEDLLSFKVNRVTKIDDSMYKVYTTEEYDISYGDGSVKYKKFNSIHKVKELSDGSLGVYQLISSTEVK
ncbi:zinc-ribbon domain-containing protein [Priestia megaterium]|uniref:zinc ribbon domain-containing protein n=1 Tax=Priestia megaterium TaxID=1404 RepID=UPI001C211356|nr:zinc-ribbon domain-containing protein [Priestia megaterium]MBU8686484.1 zinc-ribbon domain-containing protein [Priestia megaterium]